MNQDILHEIMNQDCKSLVDKIQDALKQKISDTNSKGVIFGLSGGIDSAVIAYLCHNTIKDILFRAQHLIFVKMSVFQIASLRMLSETHDLRVSCHGSISRGEVTKMVESIT